MPFGVKEDSIRSLGVLFHPEALGRTTSDRREKGSGRDLARRFEVVQTIVGRQVRKEEARHRDERPEALGNDGRLRAIGDNEYGKLGTGDTTDPSSFTSVLAAVSAVAHGRSNTLALKNDNILMWCGCNVWGELGTGDTVPAFVFTEVCVY